MKTRRGVLIVAALAGLLAVSSCAGPATPASRNGPVSGTWIEVTVSGDDVTLPAALVEKNVNTHFSLRENGRELVFMAYILDGGVQVRANACPPCRSRGFALDGDVLVCDACQTTFNARDGSGIAGACVDYPKAAVAHRVVNGSVEMTLADLVNAYDETLVAG